MPSKIVDLSARSNIIENEPFGLHFWEFTPEEFMNYLKDPRGTLASMGVKLPKGMRLETTIENHDWLSDNTRKLAAKGGPVIVCNIGTGGVGLEAAAVAKKSGSAGKAGPARDVYRVVSFAHTHDAIGKHKKTLLHPRTEQERKPK